MRFEVGALSPRGPSPTPSTYSSTNEPSTDPPSTFAQRSSLKPWGPRALFGTAIALSIDNRSGESVTLTDEQTQLIVHALARKPDSVTIERLCETLSPIPQIVDLIRSL